MPLAEQTLAQSYTGYGIFILETLLALAVIALAAWTLVRVGGHRFARTGKQSRMRIAERLVLEPKRSIYLVEIDGATFLIGVSEGSVQLLKKICDGCIEGAAPSTAVCENEGKCN